MPSYFRQVPDFEYVSRDSEQRQISEYATVKNLFRRGKLREDIFGDLTFFTKYKIIGDERPDNVAYKIYVSDINDIKTQMEGNDTLKKDYSYLIQNQPYSKEEYILKIKEDQPLSNDFSFK